MKNKTISILFIASCLIMFVALNGYELLGKIVYEAISSQSTIVYGSDNRNVIMNQTMSSKIDETESYILDCIPFKTNMVKLNGSILKKTGIRSFYNSAHKMNITTDGYNVGRYEKTSTDYEVAEMVSFKEYLDNKGIQLLYVNEPAKYTDDEFYTEQFGGESFLNRNMDLFLDRIGAAGINYLDLRECAKDEGLDCMQMFYRTDHHWTIPASVWAARQIAKKLNDDYGYNIDMKLYNEDNFNTVEYKNCWLGEQGRLVADTYIGLDDYTMMEPKYDTSYTIYAEDGNVEEEGTFDAFIDKSVYKEGVDPYDSKLWHYSYSAKGNKLVHNNLTEYGRVLILGDSYETSMRSFLSLGIRDTMVVIPRDLESSVRNIIDDGNFDTVIVSYAQFMVGAHDDENSANYRMFALE